MTTSTADVLELIAGALCDRYLSPDAMRWTPRWDEPVVHPPKDSFGRLVAVDGWDGYAASAYEVYVYVKAARALGPVFEEIGQQFTRMAAAAAATMAEFGKSMARAIAVFARPAIARSMTPRLPSVAIKPNLRRRGWRR